MKLFKVENEKLSSVSINPFSLEKEIGLKEHPMPQ